MRTLLAPQAVFNLLAVLNEEKDQGINLKIILPYISENLTEMIAINAVSDSKWK